MRVTKARNLILTAVVCGLVSVSLTGCKTPSSSSWAFWKKSPSPTSSLASGIPSGPQLPSAQAGAGTAGSTAPQFGAASAAPSYGATTAQPAYGTPNYGTPSYGAANGAAPTYPEQPAVGTNPYPNTGMPAAQPVGYNNPYQAQPGYDATHSAAPTQPAGVAPQNGPYTPNYNQGGAAAPAAPNYQAPPYTSSSTEAAGSIYNSTAAAPSAQPTAAAPAAEAPLGDRYAAQSENSDADRYGRRYDAPAAGAGEYAPSAATNAAAPSYAPTNTSYGAPAANGSERKDPGYRPGSTSDYIPPSSPRASSNTAPAARPSAGGVTPANYNAAPGDAGVLPAAPAYGPGSVPAGK